MSKNASSPGSPGPHDAPVVVAVVPNEFEARMIVAKLEAHGIVAQVTGQFTAGFLAEVPGSVRVIVPAMQREAAVACLSESPDGSD